jgi:hypothetical protein
MKRVLIVASFGAVLVAATAAVAYPPAVGIAGKSPSCAVCHADTGPWGDESRTIVDILDGKTRESLLQEDGRFLLSVPRGQIRTVITVLGRSADDDAPPPVRNAWLYVDPSRIATNSFGKFAPGWDVSLPLSCRIVGDKVPEYPGAAVTALPMRLRPGDAAQNTELELQVMLTKGESTKGNPDEWLIANFVTRKLVLEVTDP